MCFLAVPARLTPILKQEVESHNLIFQNKLTYVAIGDNKNCCSSEGM